jgi:xanthine dehydrogenase FAD-binding subunit
MFPIKSYEKARSIEHAVALLKANEKARLLAGGTDVLIKLRDGKQTYQHLVDIHDLKDLKQRKIREDGTLMIGAGVTFSQAIHSELVSNKIPMLALASATVGGPQIRNVATIGGNICNGVTSADSAPALMCLNAILQLQGVDGNRMVHISDFYLGPGKVDLRQDEVLTAFLIRPEDFEEYSGTYSKYAMRNAMDIATIGCAAACRIDQGKLDDLRLAFGVAAPIPIRCVNTEKAVKGLPISKRLIQDIENMVEKDVTPRTSWRASKEFRLQIVRELARRVVTQAIEQAGGKIL